ncbi:glycosyl hydrolase family 26 [Allonocardiopsis opalescens]|uniref:glycosyl hydrolase family 26 n=1 Tax=Allonocardiopsis opalescens TaxID=1144618 RepID=UPI001FE69964|nr:glycosyl hydrolase family 26 [Allonocardiopsis opalescens]
MRRRYRRLLACGGALSIALATACGETGPDAPPPAPPVPAEPSAAPPTGTAAAPAAAPSPSPHTECAVNDILEPSCGAWWGASPYRDDVGPLEEAMGRRLDIVYYWHGVDQAALPAEHERQAALDGRIIHLNIEARRFRQSGHPAVRYRQIIDGEFDESLRAQARNFADLGLPAFVTFDHEADADQRYNRRGTPREFTLAWRHIVDLYREEGADEVVWVWNVTGWPDNFDRLPRLWPGNGYVDWLSWEGYNMTGCDQQPQWDHVQSFADSVLPLYEWMHAHGERHGIDAGKPIMIGEMGTTPLPGGPEATADWYRAIPSVLERYPQFKAVKLWENELGRGCDFRVLNDERVTRGFVEAARAPHVNLPRVELLLDHLGFVDLAEAEGARD